MAASKSAALAAIDDALADGLKSEFRQLFDRAFAAGQRKPAIETFERGVRDQLEAHAIACASIEKIFSETSS